MRLIFLGLLAVTLMTGCVHAGPDGGLAGGPWTVSAVAGALVAAGDRAPTLNFAEGKVSGFSGCNRFSGPMRVQADRLDFGPMAATKMACLDAAANEAERVFLQALTRQVKTWAIENGRLLLRDASGAVVIEAGR
ncbi:META domain-containing protein [Chthonobacter albigriseus]|uniref:META domain-containing protein n=1 Tax=Chthonobacter albigriseus TaxID=1683161 RepID=UPI0015EE7E91|nr:META domain-containing protein [Chthonobacter albigriseus]